MRNKLPEERLEKIAKIIEKMYTDCVAQELTMREILVAAKSFQDFVEYKCKCALLENGRHETEVKKK